MNNMRLEINSQHAIMRIEEVAEYLKKSVSWVYKNWQILGGRKLKGSLFFPNKEELHERIFCKGERMEVRLHPEGNQVHRSLVQNKNQGQAERPSRGTLAGKPVALPYGFHSAKAMVILKKYPVLIKELAFGCNGKAKAWAVELN